MSSAPFKIGDKVSSKYDGRPRVVTWVSKSAKDRSEQLIATELNGYSFPYSDASCYDLVSL